MTEVEKPRGIAFGRSAPTISDAGSSDHALPWAQRAAIKECADDIIAILGVAQPSRDAVIEECVRCLEALGARYHSGRDLVAHLRACALPSTQSEGGK